MSSELAGLLFGSPHPTPHYEPREEPEECGKRSEVYGKAMNRALVAAAKLKSFTATEVAKATNMNRATSNRALIRLEKRGNVKKTTKQTGGNGRKAAVWTFIA